jgi:hypothetical protein
MLRLQLLLLTPVVSPSSQRLILLPLLLPPHLVVRMLVGKSTSFLPSA